MKNLLLILTLLFTSVFFSSPSYAGWTEVTKNVNGTTFYVDFERIRKHDGYIYYWYLQDYLKPTKYGDLSFKGYNQGDCKSFRFKVLSRSYHTQPMGDGTPSESGAVKNLEWDYPPPNSVWEAILKSVCNR